MGREAEQIHLQGSASQASVMAGALQGSCSSFKGVQLASSVPSWSNRSWRTAECEQQHLIETKLFGAVNPLRFLWLSSAADTSDAAQQASLLNDETLSRLEPVSEEGPADLLDEACAVTSSQRPWVIQVCTCGFMVHQNNNTRRLASCRQGACCHPTNDHKHRPLHIQTLVPRPTG